MQVEVLPCLQTCQLGFNSQFSILGNAVERWLHQHMI